MDDEQLEDLIMDRIGSDKRLYGSEVDVGVDVNNGNITLIGNVPTYHERRIIEDDVLSLNEVERVDNKIHVNQVKISDDDQILRNVEDVISSSGIVNSKNIDAEVDNGKVILRGIVDILWKKDQLETRVSEVDGVSDIANDIAVVLTQELSDENIARSVEDILEKNQINFDDFDIYVENGEVTLSGNLTSWEQRDDILNSVSKVDGVTRIVDDMIVRYTGIL